MDVAGIFQTNGKDDLLSLTTIGWALVNLANVMNDKLSMNDKLLLGIDLFKNPSKLPQSGKKLPEAANAYLMVKELKETGSTNRLAGVDATASGATLQGSFYHSIETLTSTLGKPMTEEEAFYAKQPDLYTSLQNEYLHIVGEEGTALPRDTIKKVCQPQFYGASENRIADALGDEVAEAFLYVFKKQLPAIGHHWNTFMNINFQTRQFAEYQDNLGRNFKLENVEDVHAHYDTCMGQVLLQGKKYVPSDKPKGMLPLLACSIFAADSTLVALAKEANLNASGLTVHDAIYVTPDRVNEIRHAYRKNQCDMVENNLLGNIYTQLCGYDMPVLGSKEDTLEFLSKSHTLLT